MPRSANRGFGFWTLVALVVGNAIGAGLYTTSGFSLADLGARHWVMLAWLVGGLVALAGALSYGMLARQLTESGGEYLYLSRNLHPLAGFIAGWISLLAGFTGAIAFSATAFEAYARAASPTLAALPPDSLAVAAILFGGAIHLVRSRPGAWIHDAIVALMLATLLAIILFGVLSLAGGGWAPSDADGFTARFSLSAFAGSLVWISLSYSGFNAAVYVAGEAQDAARNVPRAMVAGTLLILLAYLVLNAIFLYVPPPAAIAGEAEVAAIAAEALAGTGFRRAVEGVIALSLLSSVTAMVLAGPRVYAKMAEDGALPALFRMPAATPPRKAIVLQVLVALVLTFVADLRDLLSYLGFTLSLSLALAVSTLFVLHARDGIRPDSAWYPFAPALFVTATVAFALVSASREPMQFFAAAATVATGACAWFIHRLRAGRKGKRASRS